MKKNSFILLLIIFSILKVNAQYFPYDSVEVKYQVISIQKAKQKYISDVKNVLKRIIEKPDYKNKKKNILDYKKFIREIKYGNKFNLSKNAYVILLKNNERDSYHYVITLRTKKNKGKRLKVGQIYELKLERYFEKNTCPHIGSVYEFEFKGNMIRIAVQSFTDNIYISPNLKGLYYIDSVR